MEAAKRLTTAEATEMDMLSRVESMNVQNQTQDLTEAQLLELGQKLLRINFDLSRCLGENSLQEISFTAKACDCENLIKLMDQVAEYARQHLDPHSLPLDLISQLEKMRGIEIFLTTDLYINEMNLVENTRYRQWLMNVLRSDNAGLVQLTIRVHLE